MKVRNFLATASMLSMFGCGSGSDNVVGSDSANSTRAPESTAESTLADSVENSVTATTAPKSARLKALLKERTGGMASLLLPLATDLAAIPQDPANPITTEKVQLGRLLFHDTGLAQKGNDPKRAGTWSCASCHHVAAGFKAGVPQGIAEGGIGFGLAGEGRKLAPDMDPGVADDDPRKPDIQPVASPTILNSAFQAVMLWNGQFGNAAEGSVNQGIDPSRLLTAGTPKVENNRGLHGLETQAIAGLSVHRLDVDKGSLVQTHPVYKAMFDAAFPDGSDDVVRDAGFAIAAYERTVMATEAPFQRWLRGDDNALSENQLDGALLFFGRAGCAACHQGPALGSKPDAPADEMFFAIGFADLNVADSRVHGQINDADRRGRGGLTGISGDDYKFKIPQLYNLADAGFYGHGASFNSIRAVVQYKNAALAQNPAARANLDSRFVPLGLNDSHIEKLVEFLEVGLRDPKLARFVPTDLPSGQCFPVADAQSLAELGC